MNFQSFLSIILTLFSLLVVGFACRKLNIIDGGASKGFSKLILNICQPVLVISSLNNAAYSEQNLTIAWQVALIGLAVHFLVAIMAYFGCKLMKKEPDQIKIFEFTLVFSNCAFIGFPVLDSLLSGPEYEPGIGPFMGSFFVIGFHLFLWTWGIMILARGREDIKLTPKKALLNFGTIPVLLGLAVYLLKPVFTMPTFLGDCLDYLASLCTPVSVLLTGALIATASLVKILKTPRLYLHSLIKLLLLPMFFCVLTKLIGFSDLYILLVTAMVGVPSAASITMFAELYDIEPAYASSTVGMTSVLSTATLPLVMLFAQWVISL